ncbi:GNAT family protein [Gallaecimonas sp. GXIMD4217]|uniref:GNAT family N-acetyltransferase n=1 Tax=Gallaecimonas sp. GXIMD4217 TaxID=3131927 RepID=UPI00311B27AE
MLVPDWPLQTARLRLRPLDEGDFDYFQAQRGDAETMRHVGEPESGDVLRERFAERIRPWTGEPNQWLSLVACLEDGTPIGSAGLRLRAPGLAEIGYAFLPAFQGKGYALEAVRALVELIFERLACHKVMAQCTLANEGSWRLMERLGMVREGRLAEHLQVGQHWQDCYQYGLLARHWRAQDLGTVP